MSLSYQYEVASSSSGGFIRLLFRWKGSVWKLIYVELFLFSLAYASLSMLYRYGFTDSQKRVFEIIVYYCSIFMDMIPLSFLLGFYVTFTATRWWSQYTAIPWPDKIMNVIALYVPGHDDGSRMLRRTLMRYLNLSLILVLRSISKAVKRRFPTKDHLIDAGFMTKLEMEMWQSIPSTEFNTFWIPCTWFINLLREAKHDKRVPDPVGIKLILEEFNEFRAKCGMLWSYDWISIPLVYTQVVTLATYSFFVSALFGRQYIKSTDPIIDARHHFDFYVPVFTVVQYFLYMGLLKVAEQLINPFGDDDEDFELNWIIDRHIKVSYLGVDTLNGPPPPLIKDSYFYKQDYKLPYTEASVGYKKKTYRGSVAHMHVPHGQQNLVVPEMSEEEDEDGEQEQVGLRERRPSVWTLLGGRQAKQGGGAGGSIRNYDSDSAESGMVNDNNQLKGSSMQIYFREATPVEEEGKLGKSNRARQNLLQVPEDASVVSEPLVLESRESLINHLTEPGSPGILPEAIDLGQDLPINRRGYMRGFFGHKQRRLIPWMGADVDYDSYRDKVLPIAPKSRFTYCSESRERLLTKGLMVPGGIAMSSLIKSISTPDLTAADLPKGRSLPKIYSPARKSTSMLQSDIPSVSRKGSLLPLRRTSLDPSVIQINIERDPHYDPWMHYRSLPSVGNQQPKVVKQDSLTSEPQESSVGSSKSASPSNLLQDKPPRLKDEDSDQYYDAEVPKAASKDESTIPEEEEEAESPDTEYTVLIKDGAKDRPKELIIIPIEKDKTSSRESFRTPSPNAHAEGPPIFPSQRQAELPKEQYPDILKDRGKPQNGKVGESSQPSRQSPPKDDAKSDGSGIQRRHSKKHRDAIRQQFLNTRTMSAGGVCLPPSPHPTRPPPTQRFPVVMIPEVRVEDLSVRAPDSPEPEAPSSSYRSQRRFSEPKGITIGRRQSLGSRKPSPTPPSRKSKS